MLTTVFMVFAVSLANLCFAGNAPTLLPSLEQGIVLNTFSLTPDHQSATFTVAEPLPLDRPYVLSCSSSERLEALKIVVNGHEAVLPGFVPLTNRLDLSLSLQRNNTVQATFSRKPGGQLNCSVVALFTPAVYQQEVDKQVKILTFDYPYSSAAVLRLVNGTDAQAERIAQGSVSLNGQEIFGPADLNHQTILLNTEFTPLAHNELRLTLLGSPRAKLLVEVLPIDVLPPELTVTSPAEGFLSNQYEVEVVGTVSDLLPVDVTVNGLPAASDGTSFSALVPLLSEGANSLTITATDLYGRTSTMIRTVFRDTEPPVLWFTSPTGNRLAEQEIRLTLGSSEPLTELRFSHNLSPVDGDTIYPQEFFNRVEAFATDLAGNQGTIEARFVYNALMAKVVVRFPFNEGEGELAHDESLKDRHATLDGVLWTEGAAGTALSFDGISGGAVVEGVEGMQLAAEEPLTISCMVRPEPAGGPLVELTLTDRTLILSLVEGVPTLQLDGETFSAPWALRPEVWSSLTVVVKPDGLEGAIDGAWFPLGQSFWRPDQPVTALTLGLASGQTFAGALDELTIVSGGLSEQDRCRLDGGYWDETAPRQCNYALMAENLVYLDFEEIRQETLFTYVPDRSLLNNHALILGDPVLTDQGRRGRGLVFNDLDELVIDKAYHQISLQPALTIEAWLKPDAEVEPLYLVHKPDFLRVMISTDLVEVTIDPLDVHFSYEQTNILPAEEWTHLAVTVVGQRLSIYRNGNPILSEDLPRPLVDPNNLDTYYLLNPWSTHFSGVLDEFRLYDRGKSQRELCVDNYGTFYPSSAYCDLREPGEDLQRTIVYLRFDEGEGLETLDHSNHDRFGTLQGATWTEGYTGSAVQFTTGTSIELAAPEYLAFPLPELSLLLWVRPDTTADEQVLVSKGDFSLLLRDGVPVAQIAGTEYVANAAVPAGQWTNVAMVLTQGLLRFYLDSHEVLSAAATTVPIQQFVPLTLGSDYQGSLDEFRLMSLALTPAELCTFTLGYLDPITSACTYPPIRDAFVFYDFEQQVDTAFGPMAKDQTMYHNDLLLQGPEICEQGKHGKGLCFEPQDLALIPSFFGKQSFTGDFTLETWLQPSVFAESGVALVLNKPGFLELYLSENGLHLYFQELEQSLEFGFPRLLLPGLWRHLALTIEADLVRLFVDGNEVARDTLVAPLSDSYDPLFFGNEGWEEYFHGTLDDFHLLAHARSPQELCEVNGGLWYLESETCKLAPAEESLVLS